MKTAEMLSDLHRAIEEHRPFCLASMGDGEIMFYLHPNLEEIPDVDLYLQPNGVDSHMLRLKWGSVALLPFADWFYVHRGFSDLSPQEQYRIMHPATPTWAKYFHRWPDVFAAYGIRSNILPSADRYTPVRDGSLFKCIDGQRVLLVGYHALTAAGIWQYPNVPVVDVVGCPKTGAGFAVDKMIEVASSIDYDVALVGLGISANYFCLRLKQYGKIALNIGTGMNILAGVDQERTA